MTKTKITAIITATVLVVGSLYIGSNVLPALGGGGNGCPGVCPIFEPQVRDNVNVLNIKLENGQRMVLVDNAGIGGTSDVEVTWRFDPTECSLERINQAGAGSPPVTFSTFGSLFGGAPNDGAMGGNPPHRDLTGDGISLTTKPNKDCELDPGKGEFVTVSTVGSTT